MTISQPIIKCGLRSPSPLHTSSLSGSQPLSAHLSSQHSSQRAHKQSVPACHAPSFILHAYGRSHACTGRSFSSSRWSPCSLEAYFLYLSYTCMNADTRGRVLRSLLTPNLIYKWNNNSMMWRGEKQSDSSTLLIRVMVLASCQTHKTTEATQKYLQDML